MYLERILYVDLTEKRSWVRKFDAGFLSAYLGGVGLGTRLLYDHLPAGRRSAGPGECAGLCHGRLSPVRPSPRAASTRW